MDSKQSSDRIERLKQKAARLPMEPGVYIMHGADGGIIYIGKAIHLKNRVSQYFGFRSDREEKVRQMIAHVEDFEYIVCDSEFEALILECSLIKLHQPKYNILLKDDKGYHYIKINTDGWRSLSGVKQKLNDEKTAEYIGPYYSSRTVSDTIEEAKRIFKLPQCRKRFPADIRPGRRPCINYDIGLCGAPCNGTMNEEEYKEAFDSALNFIKTDSAAAVKLLRRQMFDASENLEFEKAAKLRDRINAIEAARDRQKVISAKGGRYDVIAVAKSPDRMAFEVFIYRGGQLYEREQFIFDRVAEDDEAFCGFLAEYYSKRGEIPGTIIVNTGFDGIDTMEKWLCQSAGRRVELKVPKKGKYREIADMCFSNAAEFLAIRLEKEERSLASLEELAGLLGLASAPEYIEAYDISHTSGDENVGAMIVFRNGKPLKSAYKRFKIKGFAGQDDCHSMREVLSRRFDEYEKNKDSGEGFGRLPDLILLDGGKPQLDAVMALFNEKGITVPVFGMVKDSKHRTDAIAADGGYVAIKSNRRAFSLVFSIQEEVHRFAIEYHRSLRSKKMVKSRLLEIDGIGQQKAAALMKHFGTVEKLSAASAEELKAVSGISEKNAASIIEFFKNS